MRVIHKWWMPGLAGAMLLLVLVGCTVAADFFNPTFASTLGLTPASSGQGVVIVAFNNTTRFNATFYAYESLDAVDLSRQARNFSQVVAPSEVKNEVIDCPVERVSPGSLDASYAEIPVAVVVEGQGTAEGEQVTYTGGPLISGQAFSCGDVIEIRLSQRQTGTGDQAETEFFLTVRVLPG